MPGQRAVDLYLKVSEAEEARARELIEAKIDDMNLIDMKELREATAEICAWWQSDTGQRSSFFLEQYGDAMKSTDS